MHLQLLSYAFKLHNCSQVYKKYGKELCIVATNVSTMSVEYFHPKTTPDVPVAVAVRASIAIPGNLRSLGKFHDNKTGTLIY